MERIETKQTKKKNIKEPFISKEIKEKIKDRIIRDIWKLFEIEEQKEERKESEKKKKQSERLIKDKIIIIIRIMTTTTTARLL